MTMRSHHGLGDTADTLVSYRLNDVMHILTVISVIFFPLTLMSGVYGMNVDLPLQNQEDAFILVALLMVGIVGVMIVYFPDTGSGCDALASRHLHRYRRARAALVDHLTHEPILAIDTESNSLYAYYEQVCLIQISDAAARLHHRSAGPTRCAPLGQLLADPAIENVFHAAEYDLMCLKRDYEFSHMFDTMVATRVWTQGSASARC